MARDVVFLEEQTGDFIKALKGEKLKVTRNPWQGRQTERNDQVINDN